MVTLRNNPVEMVCGEHTIPTSTADPMLYMCIALGACISKWLRKFYAFRDDITPYKFTISKDFDNGVDSFKITVECTHEDFNECVTMIDALSKECYVSKSIRQKKIYEIISSMHKHSFVVD